MTDAAEPGQPRGTNRRYPTLRTISALVLREMATIYGRSPGGYIWALVEPIGAIMILSVGFSLLLRSPSLGSSFILFYATGYLPFTLYSNLANAVSRSIQFSKPLLQFPVVTWVDAVLARFILNALTGVLVGVILLIGIVVATQARVTIAVEPLLLAVVLPMLLGLGIGSLNCVLFGLFPAWQQFWNILMRPLFIISGVFFLYDDFPPGVQDILWYNPLLHITGLMREAFFPTYTASYVSVTYVVLFSLIPLFLGTVLLSRYHRDLLNA